jgi:hypothetical protein
MQYTDDVYKTRILHMRIAKIHSLSQFLGCSVETLTLYWNLLANGWTYCIVGIHSTLAVISAPSRKILDV